MITTDPDSPDWVAAQTNAFGIKMSVSKLPNGRIAVYTYGRYLVAVVDDVGEVWQVAISDSSHRANLRHAAALHAQGVLLDLDLGDLEI